MVLTSYHKIIPTNFYHQHKILHTKSRHQFCRRRILTFQLQWPLDASKVSGGTHNQKRGKLVIIWHKMCMLYTWKWNPKNINQHFGSSDNRTPSPFQKKQNKSPNSSDAHYSSPCKHTMRELTHQRVWSQLLWAAFRMMEIMCGMCQLSLWNLGSNPA
jgi:hypothetical protein